MLKKSVASAVSAAVLIGGPGLTATAAAQTMARGAAANVSVVPTLGAGRGAFIPGAPSLIQAVPLPGALIAPSLLIAPAVSVTPAPAAIMPLRAAAVPAAAALRATPAPSASERFPAAVPKAALEALAGASARAAAAGDRFFDQSAPSAPESEIVLIRTLPAEDGRRGTGRDQSTQLEALVQRSEGKIKSLERDGPFSLFQETFAVEIKTSARAEVLAELGAIEGIEFHSLSDLLSVASHQEPRPLPDAERLAAYAGRLDKGSLAERLDAFAELASALESATPERVAALPVEARDAVAVELYDLAAVAVNTFNLVQGAARQDLRKRLHEERAEREDGWAGLEKAAQEGLKDPAIRARFEPLRTMLVRVIGAMDKLSTPGARALVMQMLPHAEHAGLEYVAARPERRALYIGEWLGTITGAVDETLEGMRLGAAR
ncbi:MAG: hypothetical protein NUW21_01440, partial [Elusimicrobia bacterium]|nr:hypothetical protein [Elusimicrobiota bacterium]